MNASCICSWGRWQVARVRILRVGTVYWIRLRGTAGPGYDYTASSLAQALRLAQELGAG